MVPWTQVSAKVLYPPDSGTPQDKGEFPHQLVMMKAHERSTVCVFDIFGLMCKCVK
jgi:hypothetical protein